MSLSRRLLHETRRLESSLDILIELSDSAETTDQHADFYRLERPLALADITDALQALRALAEILAGQEGLDPIAGAVSFARTGTQDP